MTITTSKELTPSSLWFPFLGCREDGEPFEYLLSNINNEKVNIAIAEWLVNRTTIHLKEHVDLFIPTQLNPEYVYRRNISGQVISSTRDGNTKIDFYEVCFEKKNATENEILNFEDFIRQFPVSYSLTTLVLELIKDSILIKQGIKVYLKHLVPYFSRIIDCHPKKFSLLKQIVFSDIEKHLNYNEAKLSELYESLKQKLTSTDDIPLLINLEELRELMESEICLAIFKIAFDSFYQNSDVLLYEYKNPEKHIIYLNAIKSLEKKLYSNYNQIVIVYLKSF